MSLCTAINKKGKDGEGNSIKGGRVDCFSESSPFQCVNLFSLSLSSSPGLDWVIMIILHFCRKSDFAHWLTRISRLKYCLFRQRKS